MKNEMRESLKGYCQRYAAGHQDAALDDLETFVRASIADCLHPGTCAPDDRSLRCFCQCAVCKPPPGPVMCVTCKYPRVAHGPNIFACNRFTPPEEVE